MPVLAFGPRMVCKDRRHRIVHQGCGAACYAGGHGQGQGDYSVWPPSRLFVIVTIYIDESGTHGSPVTILAGWVGRLGQWATFDPKWNRLLKRSDLSHFHSKTMRHSGGEFKGWTIAEKQAFLAKAAKLGKTLEFGFTIILGENDYQEHYLAGHRPKEVQLDSRYGLCFRYCLGLIPSLAIRSFKKNDLEISFVLKSGHVNLGDCICNSERRS
jgi:hypothetical protein